jgi:Protein of unknown function (DUF3558)
MRLLVMTLLGVGMALGLACGGDDAPSGGGSASGPTAAASASASGGSGGSSLQDACTLLSAEQVTAALGDDTIASTKADAPGDNVSRCQWDGTMTGNRYVYLTLRTVQFAMSVFDSNYKVVAGAVSVPGIGDEGYALPGVNTPNNYRYLSMAAVTSSLYIQVDVAGPERSDEEALSTLTMVMQQVVANLN